MYKLTNSNEVIRILDNVTIPADPGNMDYVEFQNWLAQGNTPEPLPSETPQQVIARLEGALDRKLDEVANEYRYESIRTMVTYATSEHPDFGREGRAAVKYRDAVYAVGIQCNQDVEAGLRPIPTEAELIAELPPFTDFLE
jgi:hypothetical protein